MAGSTDSAVSDAVQSDERAGALPTRSRKDFYVYVWLRPCGTPFYVGKGMRNRDVQPKTHNRLFMSIVNKMRRGGLEPRVVRLFCGLTNDEAIVREMWLISKLGRRDMGTGILANLTDGGEGAEGVSPETRKKRAAAQRITFSTPESRRRRSVSQKMKWDQPGYREKAAEAIREAQNRPETSKKRKASLKAHYNRPEIRVLLSERNTKRYLDPDERDATSVALRSALSSPGARKKRLMELARLRADPDIEARRVAAAAHAQRTPGARKKRSAISQRMWQSADFKAKMRAINKKAWERPEKKKKHAASLKQIWARPGHKERVSDAIRKALTTPEARAANREIQLRRPPCSASGLKGVGRNKKKWSARICGKGLGTYPTIEEAAYRYDVAALAICEDAWLNYIDGPLREPR